MHETTGFGTPKGSGLLMAAVAHPFAPPAIHSIPDAPVVAPTQPNVFVVPAYNERENIARLLEDLESRPALYATAGSRVIVVDDGSDDGTADVVAHYAGPLPVEVVRLGENQGPGSAFRAGFAAALSDSDEEAFVVTLEADTTSDLDALPEMLARASAGAELVLASVHGGGRMLNVSPLRRVLSRGSGWVIRRALGVQPHTVSSFFRVYRASLLRTAGSHYGDRLIRESGFVCKAELLAKLAAIGARIEEVPVDLDGSRRIGPSKMPVFKTLVGYWRLLLRRGLRLERGVA
jgi:dolichol-phosphate mannosyltransferase